jgi:KaiC/GvpD/RAD55 family RecA-like ATPase/uncharacterized membrane protein
VQRNQIVVLTISLVSILVLVATGVYFAISTTQNDTGGMMGGGYVSNPYSWVISVILFVAVLVLTIGVVLYFVSAKKTQNVTQQKIRLTPSDSEEINEKIDLNSFNEIGSQKIKGRVETGHLNLDRLLLGGIPPNLAVALAAPLSDEANSLIKIFMETGVKNSEITFYVTVDPILARDLAIKYPLNFYLFVCNPQIDESLKKATNVISLRSVDNLTEINIAITQMLHKLDPAQKGPKRFCLNIVSDVLLQHGLIITRKWLSELIATLNVEGFTILAVINPQMHSSEDVYALLGLFDGEIDIREAETVKELKRYLKVKRLSNQKYLKNEVLLG